MFLSNLTHRSLICWCTGWEMPENPTSVSHLSTAWMLSWVRWLTVMRIFCSSALPSFYCTSSELLNTALSVIRAQANEIEVLICHVHPQVPAHFTVHSSEQILRGRCRIREYKTNTCDNASSIYSFSVTHVKGTAGPVCSCACPNLTHESRQIHSDLAYTCKHTWGSAYNTKPEFLLWP